MPMWGNNFTFLNHIILGRVTVSTNGGSPELTGNMFPVNMQ